MTSKLTRTFLLSALIAATSLSAHAQRGPMQGSQATSPHDSTWGRVKGKLVTVYYGRPYMKDPKNLQNRTVWGGQLAPWDKAWRLGADPATTLITQSDIKIGDTLVPAGAYTLYMVPSENGSKLAISKTIGGWGIPVDEKNDLARVDLKKEDLADPVEQLTITISGTSTGATLKIIWDKSSYSVDITPSS